MQAPGSLSPEQKSTLQTVFHFIEISTVYLQSIVPIAKEGDARMLESLLELGEVGLRRLPQYFPELRCRSGLRGWLADEQEKRGGAR